MQEDSSSGAHQGRPALNCPGPGTGPVLQREEPQKPLEIWCRSNLTSGKTLLLRLALLSAASPVTAGQTEQGRGQDPSPARPVTLQLAVRPLFLASPPLGTPWPTWKGQAEPAVPERAPVPPSPVCQWGARHEKGDPAIHTGLPAGTARLLEVHPLSLS